MVANEAILALKHYRGEPVRFRMVTEVPKSLDDKIKKGIDAIYENELFDAPGPPPKYIISEVKANTKNKPIFNALNKLGKTKYGGKQMSKSWIRFNINKLSIDLRNDILINGYDPIVTGVNMDGTIQSMTVIDKSLNKLMEI